MTWRSIRQVGLVTCAAFAVFGAGVPASAQVDREARTVWREMSPGQRIRQLFVVPFSGHLSAGAVPGDDLFDPQGFGGVLLDPARGNFSNTVTAPAQVAALTDSLQRQAHAAGPRVGLLVALAQLGDAYPDSLLWNGLTPLPSPLALGATWQPDDAERIGAVAGGELAAAGVNLALAPVLDVTAEPRPASSGDLGVRTFGGSAPWVAAFGRRYVEGLHRGSQGRLATVAGNFPGIGDADRRQSEELPVVESTLPDMAAVDLLPFVTVTSAPTRDSGRTDGLLTSHVRFRSVQQQADRPISLDSGGLRYLWAQLPALGAWRATQGVLMSPGLGAPAVRRYLDPVGGALNARRVVREALMAGNDLLLMTDLGPADDPGAQWAAIADVQAWLTTEYANDQALRQAVDDAALRVLTLKQRLGLLGLEPAPRPAAPDPVAGGDEVNRVARAALTRIRPAEAAGAPAMAPRQGEHVLFIVDARPVVECAACPPYLSPDPEHILTLARRAYGASGTGRLVDDADAAAVTFRDFKSWLQANGRVRGEDTVALVDRLPAARQAEVGRMLRQADWLVFIMRDTRAQDDAGADALKLFLRSVPPGLADKRLVALAVGAPYYLDATEIAKLSAYYAVYARTDPFLTVAIRALFGDEPAKGASPVSIPGAGYDLAKVVAPALDQEPGLELMGHDATVPLTRGATVVVRTDPVEDTNGHPVPDGTRVRVRRYDREDGVFLPDIDAVTVDGRATVAMRADRPGALMVTAAFENGLNTRPLDLTIVEAGLFSFSPPDIGLTRPRVPVDWGILSLSLAAMLLAGVLVFAADLEAMRSPARLLRVLLLSVSWGLAGYLLVAAGGLHVATIGDIALWPSTWNVAYQAPMSSFLLALVPVAWAIRRARSGLR